MNFVKENLQISQNLDSLSFPTFSPFIVLGCDNIPLVGDGVCNDESNTPVCNYDGGDCCLNVINIDHCSECICFFVEFCATGFHPSVGDGFCNDETNNAECNHDGGDCCGPDISCKCCCIEKESR